MSLTMSTLFLAAMVASALVAFAAPGEMGICANSGHCAVASDHSLLQAKVNVHHAGMSVLRESRDCPEFGICKTDEAGRDARLAALEERVKTSKSRNTQVAFDCGSSGSNMEIIHASETCQAALKVTSSDPLQTLSARPVKNEDASKEETITGLCGAGIACSDCTVSQAFKKLDVKGDPANLACAGKWKDLATWAKKQPRSACFQPDTVCWAAGTAGNRLVSRKDDLQGWLNFQSWAKRVGICGTWAPASDVSYRTPTQATLTIPGTMEAAMEVETLYAKGVADDAIAFGSAGGSSGQFGVCLSCCPQRDAAISEWRDLVTNWGAAFQAANYHSPVDQLPGDYLNTYTRQNGEIWGVGSFLGYDKCGETDIPADGTQLMTPMGGIGAMKCGFSRVSGPGKKIDDASAEAIENAMKNSDQGKFAAAFANMMSTLYGAAGKCGDLLSKKDAVRFVAKIATSLKIVTSPKDGVSYQLSPSLQKTGDGKATFVKVGYAYMKVLGLLPSAWGEKTLEQEEVFLRDNYKADEEEYAWLRTAADIGFATLPRGTFDVNNPVTQQIDSVVGVVSPRQVSTPNYMKTTVNTAVREAVTNLEEGTALLEEGAALKHSDHHLARQVAGK